MGQRQQRYLQHHSVLPFSRIVSYHHNSILRLRNVTILTLDAPQNVAAHANHREHNRRPIQPHIVLRQSVFLFLRQANEVVLVFLHQHNCIIERARTVNP